MYRIGLGNTSKAPYILTPDNYRITINDKALTKLIYVHVETLRTFKEIREFTIQDISLINDFEFTKNEEAKEHVRKAVEQCLMK